MEKSLYERYGNNEPYTEPDAKSVNLWYAQESHTFFHSITGPSTNFYVGPEETHYTIPKRLLYHFSAFAKPCLEGNFAEAEANTIWLPDVSPDVFQWLLKWLYSGRFKQACRILCRVHALGERLLLNGGFQDAVRAGLSKLVERAKECGHPNPFSPEIIEEVLSESAPVTRYPRWSDLSLRSFLFQQLHDYDFCAEMDFMKCTQCFKLDGAFAAALMLYRARELEWAVELWRAQTESVVDVVGKKLQLAEEEGNSQSMVKIPQATFGRLAGVEVSVYL
ncbi:MAG: hypothetical protein Q9175_008236 [Cornicularia normoerica]